MTELGLVGRGGTDKEAVRRSREREATNGRAAEQLFGEGALISR